MGSKTTLAVDVHNDQPDICIDGVDPIIPAEVALPYTVLRSNSLMSSGVTTTAANVEHDVNTTDNATFALAM